MNWLHRFGAALNRRTGFVETDPAVNARYDRADRELAGELLCVCDEEGCWCAATVAGWDTPCPECVSGRHVWTPGGARL